MKRSLLILAGTSILLGACAREPGEISTPQAKPPVERSIRIENFAMGTAVGMHGGIVKGGAKYAFERGELIHVAMELKHAPVGSLVHVVWKGPGQEKLGEEAKQVRSARQKFINFVADGSSLPLGENYRVEISVNGQPLTELYFDLVSPLT